MISKKELEINRYVYKQIYKQINKQYINDRQKN
jgi:hypothetical protein